MVRVSSFFSVFLLCSGDQEKHTKLSLATKKNLFDPDGVCAFCLSFRELNAFFFCCFRVIKHRGQSDTRLNGCPTFWRQNITAEKKSSKGEEGGSRIPRDHENRKIATFSQEAGHWVLNPVKFRKNRILLDAEPQIGKTNAALYLLKLLKDQLSKQQDAENVINARVFFPPPKKILPGFDNIYVRPMVLSAMPYPKNRKDKS